MSTQPTPRQQAREQTMRRILDIARDQLEAQGPAGLSLREVTRELGMVSSAVYRYVAGRDQLLTLLLVDAFEDLAGTVEAALDAQPPAGAAGADATAHPDDGGDVSFARGQLRVLSLTMRSWAVEHRAQWTLLYGTPVAEYHAPAEVTTYPGTRVIGRLLRIITAAGVAREAGRRDEVAGPGPGGGADPHGGADADANAAASLHPALIHLLSEASAELGVPDSTAAQQIAATAFFSGIVGAINAELFTHWGPQFDAHGAELFTAQVHLLADAVLA